ncbi:FG-GAP repeat domain-containing protein [Micromonospora sp. NPDC048930]|uniref:FG-GAP repeat domain-containing protein n=1 Tax=Micromonospora sp. NPDC048930 TaxID=3364261 RepID=UPI00371A0CF6
MGRRIPAGAIATTLALGLLTIPATPATAEPGTAPREIAVIPESAPTALANETLVFAGRTGFLHRHNTSPDYLWTRYDSGATTVVSDLAGVASTALKSAGGDSVSTTAQVPARPAPGKVSVLDLSDQSWQQWEIPIDRTLWGVYGQRMLLRTSGTDLRLELRTFAEDGTSTTAPVTGIPSGAASLGLPRAADLTSAVITYQAGGKTLSGLLDLPTATLMPIPGAPYTSIWRLSGDTVAWGSVGGTFELYSRTGLTSGTDTSARVVTVPQDSTLRSAVVDGGLVVSRYTNTNDYYPVISVPVQTTAPRPTLLPKIAPPLSALIQAPDGAALVVGGSGYGDWAVHRITGAPGQTPTVTPVLPVRDPVENAGLTYDQGLVRHVQTQVSPTTGANQYAVFSHPIFPDKSITAQGLVLPAAAATCASDTPCLRLTEGNKWGVAYLVRGGAGGTDTAYAINDASSTAQRADLPTTNGRIIDAGGDFVLVNDDQMGKQYAQQVGAPSPAWTAPIRGASLWFDTLWAATGTAGQLRSSHLFNRQSPRTVSTGSACVPTDVQATARWLWWTCGASGPAGVYDLQNNRNVPVPAGPVLLGDGFLVRHENGGLQLTDFHDGTVQAPVKLADLPAGKPADGRGVTWAVDRHGSGVAYVDANNAVHVLDTGVPGTAPQIGENLTSAGFYPRSTNQLWHAWIAFSRPLYTWELTVRRKWTGEVVHRETGSMARRSVSGSWDGRLPSGETVLNGAYTWTLTGTTTETSAPVTVGSGDSVANCGTFPFRGYACDGGPGLLGVKSTGEAHWYGTHPLATGPGQLRDNGYTESWCLSCTGSARTSALVPFGDYNGDAYPDLLVRDGNGYMKAHLGIGQLHFGGRSTKSLGGGWMMYKSILAPGDVNRDGHDDILGIDTYGKLWLYTTTGTGGINSRVQVGSGWNIYKRVTGAGDLNGDGHGDLIGIDAYGVMYTYFSNGNKGWSSRTKVYGGWNMYNTVIAIGDLNEDGRNDLVARDAYGVLWHYAGLGNGSFAARVKAGTGWNMYKIII